MESNKGFNLLETPIEYLKGVGPKRADLLKKELDIFTFHDLLHHFPFRYVDRSKFYTIAELCHETDAYIQLKGKISDLRTVGEGRGKRLVAEFSDGTGIIEVVWFQGIKWVKERLKENQEYILFGKPSYFKSQINFVHPELETPQEDDTTISSKLQPVYSTTEKLNSMGLNSKGIGKLMKTALMQTKGCIPESLPISLIQEKNMLTREEALFQIHFPASLLHLEKARYRLRFDELFFLQLRLLSLNQIRKKRYKGFVFEKVGNYFNTFYQEHLPFQLTNAQKRVIKEIRADLRKGLQMNRLLQGDVGSGKTLVALMSMLIALDNGFQACLMAPTEILAEQHFRTISLMLGKMPVQVELLTGTTRTPQRKKILQHVADGKTHILIGTHALIEDRVQFAKLGLVVIDEQHRFGVEQRARLWNKQSDIPHVLVMTATPIPRTLAMTLYGDLDVSIIDELPPGRKPVITRHATDAHRLRIFGFMKEQIRKGRQIYVVYPLINESDTLELTYLYEGFEVLSREFPLPHYAISIVHGQLKKEDKEFEMNRFIKGETQILVSTTVIEVGVDIPNASVMIIENAERFGLSQLHQLRGRVGRGADQSYCILVTGKKLTSDGRKRIQTMVSTNDGFQIANVDLEIRGPGELDGTRQSGMINLKLTDLVHDEKYIKEARYAAETILAADPNLTKHENIPVANMLKYLAKSANFWSMVS